MHRLEVFQIPSWFFDMARNPLTFVTMHCENPFQLPVCRIFSKVLFKKSFTRLQIPKVLTMIKRLRGLKRDGDQWIHFFPSQLCIKKTLKLHNFWKTPTSATVSSPLFFFCFIEKWKRQKAFLFLSNLFKLYSVHVLRRETIVWIIIVVGAISDKEQQRADNFMGFLFSLPPL